MSSKEVRRGHSNFNLNLPQKGADFGILGTPPPHNSMLCCSVGFSAKGISPHAKWGKVPILTIPPPCKVPFFRYPLLKLASSPTWHETRCQKRCISYAPPWEIYHQYILRQDRGDRQLLRDFPGGGCISNAQPFDPPPGKPHLSSSPSCMLSGRRS